MTEKTTPYEIARAALCDVIPHELFVDLELSSWAGNSVFMTGTNSVSMTGTNAEGKQFAYIRIDNGPKKEYLLIIKVWEGDSVVHKDYITVLHPHDVMEKIYDTFKRIQ